MAMMYQPSGSDNRRFDGGYELRYDVKAFLFVFQIFLDYADNFGADDDAVSA
jgi:hypothetical protein